MKNTTQIMNYNLRKVSTSYYATMRDNEESAGLIWAFGCIISKEGRLYTNNGW